MMFLYLYSSEVSEALKNLFPHKRKNDTELRKSFLEKKSVSCFTDVSGNKKIISLGLRLQYREARDTTQNS